MYTLKKCGVITHFFSKFVVCFCIKPYYLSFVCVCVCVYFSKKEHEILSSNPPTQQNNWCLLAQLIKFRIIE